MRRDRESGFQAGIARIHPWRVRMSYKIAQLLASRAYKHSILSTRAYIYCAVSLLVITQQHGADAAYQQ